ncbi:MAG: hypothetical protein ACFFFB_04640 [Candidatus Heimdallarchaeota archaeon]
MVQAYEKIVYIESSEIEIHPVKETVVDDLLGDLNPRYFEEVYTLKEAKVRDCALQANIRPNNSFFGGF